MVVDHRFDCRSCEGVVLEGGGWDYCVVFGDCCSDVHYLSRMGYHYLGVECSVGRWLVVEVVVDYDGRTGDY